MERFDSIYEAMRHIRLRLPEIEEYEELYLMINESKDCFWVSDDESDLEKELEDGFYQWGYESGDPEKHAESFEIWAYILRDRKERHEILYRDYKRTPLSQYHIRGKAKWGGEVVASFSVSTC